MKQFFQDSTGALSMMRLIQFLVVVAILLVFLSANLAMAINAIKHGTAVSIADFQPQMIWAIATVVIGKVVQSATGEKQEPEQPKQQ